MSNLCLSKAHMHGAFWSIEGPSPAPSSHKWNMKDKNQDRPIEIGRPDWRKIVWVTPLRFSQSRVRPIPLNHGHSAMNLFSSGKMTQIGLIATILWLG